MVNWVECVRISTFNSGSRGVLSTYRKNLKILRTITQFTMRLGEIGSICLPIYGLELAHNYILEHMTPARRENELEVERVWAGIGIGIWKYYRNALIEIKQKKSSEFARMAWILTDLDFRNLILPALIYEYEQHKSLTLVTDQEKDVSTVDTVSWLSKHSLTQILRQHKS